MSLIQVAVQRCLHIHRWLLFSRGASLIFWPISRCQKYLGWLMMVPFTNTTPQYGSMWRKESHLPICLQVPPTECCTALYTTACVRAIQAVSCILLTTSSAVRTVHAIGAANGGGRLSRSSRRSDGKTPSLARRGAQLTSYVRGSTSSVPLPLTMAEIIEALV